jgi:hypothetical protein
LRNLRQIKTVNILKQKKKIYVWKKPEPTNLHQEETAGQKKKGKYRNDNIPPHTNMSTETHRQGGTQSQRTIQVQSLSATTTQAFHQESLVHGTN